MAENKLYTTYEIFNQKFFRIPDFQRGFAWGKDELDYFWEDIMNLSEDRIHYTGMLTIESIRKTEVRNERKWKNDLWLLNKGLKPYYLVDGQQRITTIIILVKVILDRFDDKELINYERKANWIAKFLYQGYDNITSFIFGYEKDNPSDEYFRNKILDQPSVSAALYPETLYTYNLELAKKFLTEKTSKLKKKELMEIFGKLLNSLKFNLYEIDEEIDVYVAFETMNNRGKDLTNLELMKNRLIYLTTLLDKDDSQKGKLRKSINDAWKTIYEYLGKNRKKILQDDEFLKNHWIMCFKFEKGESESYANFLMHEHFTTKNVLDKKIGYKEIYQYVESISKSVIIWYNMFNPDSSKYDIRIVEYLKKLIRLGHASFAPIILTALYKDSSSEKTYQLLSSMEKFIFTVFNLNMRPSYAKSNYFFRCASDFYKGKLKIDQIIEDINWHLVDDENNTGWYSAEDLKLRVNDFFDKDEGFYSWKGLKYLLYEYELDLQKDAKGEAKLKWEDINQESIEHIYPKTANTKCWKDQYNIYTAKQKKHILNSLGNLLLLSRSKNSEWSNECFDFKKKHENKKGGNIGYFNGSYSEIEVSECRKWTDKEILKRGIKILDFIESNWKIEIGNYKTKKQILHLDFVN